MLASFLGYLRQRGREEDLRGLLDVHAPDADAVVMSAAVSDFRPSDPSPEKLKKEDGLPALALERAIRFQSIASTLGGVVPISRADAQKLRPQKYRDAFMDDYWASWVRRVEREHHRAGEARGPVATSTHIRTV